MTTKVVWTPTALHDFRSAFEYIQSGGLYKHRETLDSIEETLEALRKNPSVGRSVRSKTAQEIKVPKSPFIIAYRNTSEKVEVLSLFHKSRIWK